MKNKKAFTLIELLVVVLIIGILSAIALPQYQVSVMKTRYVQTKLLARKLAEAQRLYKMETGEYAQLHNELTIQIGGEKVCPSCDGNDRVFDWGECTLHYNFAQCTNTQDGVGHEVFYDTSEHPWEICGADQTNEKAKKVCQSETGLSQPNENFVSPINHSSGKIIFSDMKGYRYQP